MTPTVSAIPDVYYAIFAFYEPAMCIMGMLGAFLDPKKTHDMQAPWPHNTPPSNPLPRATLVTVAQLAHVCALMGTVNYFLLTAARKYLATQPIVQERIVAALLGPLMMGDIFHTVVTIWALGDEKWHPERWSPMLWTTLIIGFTLMIPRIAWWAGVGRFTSRRDGHSQLEERAPSSEKSGAHQ
ncbi:hypothetical protein PUNSTDRAFT_99959 [Punctularia strigosozonata HHB-11173 SS5]|uniref:uncharacterized protein n=1 Tax=Punctularia strigosozonata (strain HHB-11173) TaxID=741275 RepID=UPI00044173F7|nr:uncharacterized protein PUNSTDRAFT_99959 [Punctularia strigosozonata HHB-11173 SS5]EIN10437.1 hypothetical protein PUNSTDRAFT_99959 [Punctularia strigosozonata HHB-11173 SS5]